MTPQKAIESSGKSVGLLSKNNSLGYDNTIKALGKMFVGISMYFDNQLEKPKADAIAAEILADYELRSLKLEDFVAFFNEFKLIGNTKITVSKVLKELKAYWSRRVEIAIELNRNKQSKNELFSNDIDERMRRTIRPKDTINKHYISARIEKNK